MADGLETGRSHSPSKLRGYTPAAAPAVTIGIQHLHAEVGQLHRRHVAHESGQVEAAIAQVAPGAHRAVHFEDIGQAVTGEIGQLIVGAAERSGRQIWSADRGKTLLRRFEAGIVKFEGREPLRAWSFGHRRLCHIEVGPAITGRVDDQFIRGRDAIGRLDPFPSARRSASTVYTSVAAIPGPEADLAALHIDPGTGRHMLRTVVLLIEGLNQAPPAACDVDIDHR
jgi:hypothetical protein